MKKLLIFTVAFMLSSFQFFAEEKKQDKVKPPKSVIFKTKQLNDGNALNRAPLHVDIDAYYYADTNTIEIYSDEDISAEVKLYLDDILIDYSPEVNAIFEIPGECGTYKIEVTGSSWISIGYIVIQ